jgi:accessory gene regulator B
MLNRCVIFILHRIIHKTYGYYSSLAKWKGVHMVEYLSHFLATSLKNEDKHNKMRSYEVLVYGLKIIINTLSVICLTLLLGWIFGWFYEVIIVMVSFALLRSFSGGYHIKSSELCILVSSGLMFLITMTHELISIQTYIYVSMNLISLIVMIMFAPSKAKIKKEPKRFFVYKIVSSLMIIMLYVIHNDLITITFFVQTLTIIIEKKVQR